MSCQEIWSFFLFVRKRPVSPLGLIRNNSSIKPTTRALGRHSWCGRRRWFWRFSVIGALEPPLPQPITIFSFLSFFLIYYGTWHTKLTTLAILNCTAQGPLACSQIVQPSPLSSSRFHHPRRSRLPRTKPVIPSSQPLAATNLLSSMYLPIRGLHVNGIICCVAFYPSLASFT